MKKLTVIITTCINLMYLEAGIAQDLSAKSLTVSGGMSQMIFQDRVYSPFIHTDQSLSSFGAAFEARNKYLQFAHLNLSYNTSRLGDYQEMDMGHHKHTIMPHEFVSISGSYGLGGIVHEKGYLSDWVGGSVTLKIHAGFYNFILSNMFGYLIDFSANAWVRRDWHLQNNHKISTRIEVPVLTWLARPPYLAEDDEFIENISSHKGPLILMEFALDGSFVTWNRYQRIQFNFDYTLPLFEKFRLGARYQFEVVHTTEPRTLTAIGNQLHITSSIEF